MCLLERIIGQKELFYIEKIIVDHVACDTISGPSKLFFFLMDKNFCKSRFSVDLMHYRS